MIKIQISIRHSWIFHSQPVAVPPYQHNTPFYQPLLPKSLAFDILLLKTRKIMLSRRTPSKEREPFRSGDITVFPRRVSACSDERCILIKISPEAQVHVLTLAVIHVQRQSVTCSVRCFEDGISLRLVFTNKNKSQQISVHLREFLCKSRRSHPILVFINMLRKNSLRNSKTYKIKSLWFISDTRTKIIFPDFHARISY